MEKISDQKITSFMESFLFVSEGAQSLAEIKKALKSYDISSDKIKKLLKGLEEKYEKEDSGVFLQKVAQGYQIRTKEENVDFLTESSAQTKQIRLSRSALEVLSVICYKKACTRLEIEEVRGVSCSQVLRTLMEKSLIQFAGKSDVPGKPMMYTTTKKFLEIFSLNSLDDLPSLSEIDEMMPDQDFSKEEKLDEIEGVSTAEISEFEKKQYEHLEKIGEEIHKISTTTDFFEQEKKQKKDQQKAFFIEKKIKENKEVSEKELKWFESYKKEL